MASYATEVLADSPLFYLRLGQSGGTTISDSSGNDRSGVSVGLTWGVAGLLTGDHDTAASLNGSNNYAYVNPATGTGTWMGSTQWTAECLFRKGAAATGAIMGRYTSTNQLWYLEAGASLVFTYRTAAGGVQTVTIPGATLAVSTTYHLAVTYDASVYKVYLDGTLVYTSPTHANVPDNDSEYFWIGTRAYSNYFNGTIDEVAFYATALSATRISDHYTAATTSPGKEGTADVVLPALTFAADALIEQQGHIDVVLPALSFEATAVQREAVLAVTLPALVASAEAVVAGTTPATGATSRTVRWRFSDGTNLYELPMNPDSMTSPTIDKSYATAWSTTDGEPRARTFMTGSLAKEWEFSGPIRSEAQHLALETWSRKPGKVLVSDHLGRTFEVMFTKYEATDRRPTRRTPWRARYVMKALLLRRLS